eukprot:augustus_masked-scaffold_4-processed-gene-3.49-mRNA-1 protein AED:0.16 eAED:0.18 QI:0/-1/0/1/-1/1/1/0/556
MTALEPNYGQSDLISLVSESSTAKIGFAVANHIIHLAYQYDPSLYGISVRKVNAFRDNSDLKLVLHLFDDNLSNVQWICPNQAEYSFFSLHVNGEKHQLLKSLVELDGTERIVLSVDKKFSLATKFVITYGLNLLKQGLCEVVNGKDMPLQLGQWEVDMAMQLNASSRAPYRKRGIEPRRTPVMGYNTWNAFHCNVDENEVRRSVQFLLDLGLLDLGYEFINIDDCWQGYRDKASTKISSDRWRFPSGLATLGKFIHSKGFKFGIYTSRTSLTCQRRIASYNHEKIDAETYCNDFDIDFLKIDECFGEFDLNRSISWSRFKQGFDKCRDERNREVLMSVEYCRYQDEINPNCGSEVTELANMWRTTDDIHANFQSVMSNAHANDKMKKNASPGRFNDPDMLEVGNVGLNIEEQKTQFTLWAVMSSPLIIGTDLSTISIESLMILKNKKLIDVNQDVRLESNVQGGLMFREGEYEIWKKDLWSLDVGKAAVAVVNIGESGGSIDLKFEEVFQGISGKYVQVQNLWENNKEVKMNFSCSLKVEVKSHGTSAFLLTIVS